jgi:hypothetical protein
MLTPGLAGRNWVGDDAESTGVGVVLALKNDAPVRGWLEGAALADAVDFAATALAGDDIPKASRLGIMALAGASAVGCALVARSIDD